MYTVLFPVGIKQLHIVFYYCFFTVWWSSGSVTRHAALWSRIRIPEVVGKICNHIYSSFSQLFFTTPRWFFTPPIKKKLQRSYLKFAVLCGCRLSVHPLSIHNRVGVAHGRSAFKQATDLNIRALIKIRYLFVVYLFTWSQMFILLKLINRSSISFECLTWLSKIKFQFPFLNRAIYW